MIKCKKGTDPLMGSHICFHINAMFWTFFFRLVSPPSICIIHHTQLHIHIWRVSVFLFQRSVWNRSKLTHREQLAHTNASFYYNFLPLLCTWCHFHSYFFVITWKVLVNLARNFSDSLRKLTLLLYEWIRA